VTINKLRAALERISRAETIQEGPCRN